MKYVVEMEDCECYEDSIEAVDVWDISEHDLLGDALTNARELANKIINHESDEVYKMSNKDNLIGVSIRCVSDNYRLIDVIEVADIYPEDWN